MPTFDQLAGIGNLQPGTFAELMAAITDLTLKPGTGYVADTLLNPTGSDAVTVIAPIAVDSVSPELLNRLYDDTTEEAAVIADEICPAGVVSVRFVTWVRAIVPVVDKTVIFRAYGMDTSGAPSAWSSAVAMDTITTTASTDWIVTTHAVIAIGSLNIVAGEPCRINLARNPAGDTLVADAALQRVLVEWV